MSDTQIDGVDFATIQTQDIDRAVDFYANTLGLTETARWGSMPGVEFDVGNLTLAVMQPDAFGMEFSPSRAGIALHVADVEAKRAELEAKGVQFVMDTIDSGVCHQCYFTDPDGNVLGLHHRYKEGRGAPGAG